MRRIAAALLLLTAIAFPFATDDDPPIPPPREIRAVVLGDSVAHGAGDERGMGINGQLDRRFRGLPMHAARTENLGIDGARTADLRRLLTSSRAKLALSKANVVVLSVGGNDLYGDPVARLLSALVPAVQERRVATRVERIVNEVLAINPAANVYVLGLYNPYRHSDKSNWLDEQVNLWDARLISQFAANRRVTVVRICDLLKSADRISSRDHFHPGFIGYAAIADRITASMGLIEDGISDRR